MLPSTVEIPFSAAISCTFYPFFVPFLQLSRNDNFVIICIVPKDFHESLLLCFLLVYSNLESFNQMFSVLSPISCLVEMKIQFPSKWRGYMIRNSKKCLLTNYIVFDSTFLKGF